MIVEPASVVSKPPRQWEPGAPPAICPDPDVLIVDPAFQEVVVDLTSIRRLWTGARWAEGPAWRGQGRYLVFSDVHASTQHRCLWDGAVVLPFRYPSHHSNGNTFDFQGRQIGTEGFNRRVVRFEHDGSVTVIADSFDGKPLNSPNDVAPRPDGGVWFTDPPYGARLLEGHADFPGGPANPEGRLNPFVGQPDAGVIGGKTRSLPTNTYRWDPSGRLDVMVSGEDVADPNGLCFSPDYQTLYLVSTGKGPGDERRGDGVIYAFDMQGGRPVNKRLFSDMVVDGVKCGPDGIRADVHGNLWCGSSAPLGYAGVTVWNAKGKLVGRIRLPEVCANVTFGGPKRDHLFMAASQSLYVLQVATQGAAPA